MTTDEILAGIDRSLAAIESERERLVAARAQLAEPAALAEKPRPRGPMGRRRRPRGAALQSVLASLDRVEARTAGEVAVITKLGRPLVASTLTRAVRNSQAAKAARGYVRV